MELERRNKIIKALEAKGAKQPCSRCNHKVFEIVGETSILFQNDPNSYTIGGPSIATVIVGCPNCGHVWQHALGTLNLIKGAE